MKVAWTPQAQQDRADIWDHIAAKDPSTAAKMDQLFSDATANLTQHPRLGRPGKIPGTRELISHESYQLVYEIDDQTLWILALAHTHTTHQWPKTCTNATTD